MRRESTSVAASTPSASRSKLRGSVNCMNQPGRSRIIGIATSW